MKLILTKFYDHEDVFINGDQRMCILLTRRLISCIHPGIVINMVNTVAVHCFLQIAFVT
jgi:hypothetical protein